MRLEVIAWACLSLALISAEVLAPGVFLAFLWPRASAVGVFAGLLAGYAALLLPVTTRFWRAWLPEWDTGLIAMAINATVAIAVSAAWPRRVPAASG